MRVPAPFIVIEGIDGAGTTTQTEHLAAAFQARGQAVLATREPTDGPLGRLIRDRLRTGDADPHTMALLFTADRLDHLRNTIVPAINAGTVVLSDRFAFSTFAYQGLLTGEPFVRAISASVRRPDVTILLRVAPETAWARLQRRFAAGAVPDVFERLSFLRDVAALYDRLAAAADHPVRVIDGERPINEVTEAVLAALTTLGFFAV